MSIIVYMPSLFGNHPVSVKVLCPLKKAEQQTGNKVKVTFEKSPVQGPEWRWFKKHLMPKGKFHNIPQDCLLSKFKKRSSRLIVLPK